MHRQRILTHRGLEPACPNFYSESSWEAFNDHLNRGMGIEFDFAPVVDDIVIHHDLTLHRTTSNQDSRLLKDIFVNDFRSLKLIRGRTCTLVDVLNLISKYAVATSALHFKGCYQTSTNVKRLVQILKNFSFCFQHLLIFDVKTSIARILKKTFPDLSLGASVAHPFDKERFNQSTNGTLYHLEEILVQRELYDWAVLDEWDRKDRNNSKKKLYTCQVVDKLRRAGFKVLIISPELHAAELHEDVKNTDSLFRRIREILATKPDLICTNYPEEVFQLGGIFS